MVTSTKTKVGKAQVNKKDGKEKAKKQSTAKVTPVKPAAKKVDDDMSCSSDDMVQQSIKSKRQRNLLHKNFTSFFQVTFKVILTVKGLEEYY